MYTPQTLLAELRSSQVSQKAVDIASIFFLVTSYMYSNSDSSTVQPDNVQDMKDFSYLPFGRKLRIREVAPENSNRTLVFSYYNPISETHEVASIVYGFGSQEFSYSVPRSWLRYRELQQLEDASLIPYADITGLVGHNDYAPLQATLESGAFVSESYYSRLTTADQLANVLEAMLEIGDDFYDISPTVSYVEKQYENRLI